MTKRKAGPPGPAFRKVAAGNNPDRWSSVPCYRNAPTEGHGTRENRGTEVTSKQTCGETPWFGASAHMGLSSDHEPPHEQRRRTNSPLPPGT
jgi:hypothetical protein